MLDQNGPISSGTAFFVEQGDDWFVVTNWHIVSGKHFLTKEPVDSQGRCPTRIVAKLSTYDIGDRRSKTFGIGPLTI